MSDEEQIPAILQEHPEQGDKTHLKIAENVGAMAVELLKETDTHAIVVFGGDTLYGIVSQMDGFRIRPQIEILPGVVQSEIEYEGRKLLAVTKAGGFGEKDTLLKIFYYYGGEEKNVRGEDTESWAGRAYQT